MSSFSLGFTVSVSCASTNNSVRTVFSDRVAAYAPAVLRCNAVWLAHSAWSTHVAQALRPRSCDRPVGGGVARGRRRPLQKLDAGEAVDPPTGCCERGGYPPCICAAPLPFKCNASLPPFTNTHMRVPVTALRWRRLLSAPEGQQARAHARISQQANPNRPRSQSLPVAGGRRRFASRSSHH